MHRAGSGPISGLATATRTIWREDGVRGFYRGCATNLLRTTPAAALTFTSFELISRFMRSMSHAAELEQAAAQQRQQEQEEQQQQQQRLERQHLQQPLKEQQLGQPGQQRQGS
jgi:solute carrier family 25 folate transporter 32